MLCYFITNSLYEGTDMKYLYVFILSLFLLSCGDPSLDISKNLNNLSNSSIETQLPPVIKTFEIGYYTQNNGLNENDIYDIISKDILEQSKNTSYQMVTKIEKYPGSKTKRVKTISGLENKLILNKVLLFQYKNGYFTGTHNNLEATVKQNFIVSLNYVQKKELDGNNFKYEINVNIHQPSEYKPFALPYSNLAPSDTLIYDIIGIINTVNQKYSSLYNLTICNKKSEIFHLSGNKDRIRLNMNLDAEMQKKLGYFDIKISEVFSSCDLEKSYYGISLIPKEGFRINSEINPQVVMYKDFPASENIVVNVNTNAFDIKIKNLLVSYFKPIAYRFKKFKVLIYNIEMNRGGLLATIGLENDSKEYIQLKYLSLHLFEHVFSQKLDYEFPPESARKISLKIEKEDVLDEMLNTYLPYNKIEANIGVSIQYAVNGALNSEMKSEKLRYNFSK